MMEWFRGLSSSSGTTVKITIRMGAKISSMKNAPDKPGHFYY
jgi:hypothetical protein